MTEPSPETVAEAMRLASEGLGVRAIGERLGISKTTAADYVKRGRDAAAWIEVYDRGEQQKDQATRLISMLSRLYSKARQFEPDGDPDRVPMWLTIAEQARKFEAQYATLLGLNAPSRVAVGEDKPDGAAPDAGLLRAVRAMRDRDALDTRELNAGRPGVIEGGGQGNE